MIAGSIFHRDRVLCAKRTRFLACFSPQAATAAAKKSRGDVALESALHRLHQPDEHGARVLQGTHVVMCS